MCIRMSAPLANSRRGSQEKGRALIVGAVYFFLLVTIGQAAEPAAEHPLAPVLEYAQRRLEEIDTQIKDYTCTVVMRERSAGQLSNHTHASTKVRHRQVRDGNVVPFSVYMRFLSPVEIRDREVVYVEGRNKDKMIVRRGGRLFDSATVAIDPQSDLAMRESHYPITEMGVRNLLTRLIEVGQEELEYGEVGVEYFEAAKVNGRVCTVIQVTHPVRRDHFRYHVARVFIDDECKLPIRYASYDWPKEENGDPRLVEEYTFLNLKINVGLGELDFDHRNENYAFWKDFQP
jgi:hypothetical protein